MTPLNCRHPQRNGFGNVNQLTFSLFPTSSNSEGHETATSKVLSTTYVHNQMNVGDIQIVEECLHSHLCSKPKPKCSSQTPSGGEFAQREDLALVRKLENSSIKWVYFNFHLSFLQFFTRLSDLGIYTLTALRTRLMIIPALLQWEPQNLGFRFVWSNMNCITQKSRFCWENKGKMILWCKHVSVYRAVPGRVHFHKNLWIV